jgi:hypothetical protein
MVSCGSERRMAPFSSRFLTAGASSNRTMPLAAVSSHVMRNVPGRKTDLADAVWGASLIEHGLVRPSFIPPEPFRALRDLTRYRKALAEERSREVQRLHKVLEDAGVKLSSVASHVLTKSGRAMIDAPIAGERDPKVLADMAKGVMRKKIPVLQDALAGRFNEHHALLCASMLARIDQTDATYGLRDCGVTSPTIRREAVRRASSVSTRLL